ncbi:HD domain-containing protein [Psychrobacter alimentarius]|uniref:HD domain-containing protein n=1 Tax=Psychrobacter alimentarius TaxID=261164 RepID=UPI0019187146|nr:ATP-binding protein [Psychrobacter alimentarius]
MSAGLIKHLKRKTEEDSNTRILMSQWEFDEKLVGKSLENVSSYYPHFSSHNESHSQQILVNIERLLGSNIEKLTATDTWLILEAAYWHDIGMLFNADEVQDVVKNEKFKDYVEELANNNVQDLHEFARVWHNDGWEAALVHYDNPYKGVEKYRQMVAEWYRKGHAKNSNDVVLKPFEKLNINSPRTELLPKRIYRYLGQICWSHGRNFEEVMSLLPFRQTGMGTEDCHPRFVACLLRLGDLFDIDDNRFCPVMARQVGNMPSLSETHEQKHKAIREFQLDSETVSVTAICSTEMAYIECRNWFDWIREEIQNQMSQWKNIVPSRDFGLLPTINKLDVEMTDKKILLNDKPMKFSLDERSAIELLQGNNLYEDDMSIYRELIQNAIDATMIRVWLEHGQKYSIRKLPKNSNPYDSETKKLFEDYPINFSCKKSADDNDNTFWLFIIKDNGVGISRRDLEYMQKIAGSKKNNEKKKIIHKMPKWMQPSGEFGIGLQSAFLLMKDLPIEHQKITIYTKSRITHESLKIELNSPLSNKSGYCFIEEINDLGEYGTELHVTESFSIINMKEINNPKSIDLFSKVKYIYNNNELEVIEKLNSIYKNISNNTVFFRTDQRLLNTTYKSAKNTDISPKLIHRNNMYWNNENLTALKPVILEFDEFYDGTSIVKINGYRHKRIPQILYKGQFLKLELRGVERKYYRNTKNSTFLDDFVCLIMDIYIPETRQIVSLSRDKVNDSDKVFNLLLSSYDKLLQELRSKSYSSINLFDGNIRKNSLFLKLNNIDSDDTWQDFKLDEGLTIKDVLNEDKISLYSHEESRVNSIIGYSNFITSSNAKIVKSSTLKALITNKTFRDILRNNGFHIYSQNTRFLRGEIEFLSKDKVEMDFLEELIDDIKTEVEDYHFDLDRILVEEPSKFDSSILTLNIVKNFIPLEKIDVSLIDKLGGEISISNLKLSFGNTDYILIPYIKIKGNIIEISNDQIFKIFSSNTDIDFNQFSLSYEALKNIIIDYAKTNKKEWYKSYLTGKDFKPIDLTRLNE